jgi:hypothetical protein
MTVFILIRQADYFITNLHVTSNNSMALVHEQTIMTERLPLAGEISADRGVLHSQHGGSLTAVISVF